MLQITFAIKFMENQEFQNEIPKTNAFYNIKVNFVEL